MDWFKRYGISGSWFLIFVTAWIYVLYPCKIKVADLKYVFGLIVITFLPIGYFLTIFQQSIYLTLKCLGIHRRAISLSKFPYPINYEDEPALEVYSTFSIFRNMESDYLKRYQDWIRRRMDVLVIDMTILLEPIFILIFAIIFPLLLGWKPQLYNIKLFIGFSIFYLIMWGIVFCNMKKIRSQIIIRLTEIYCIHKEKRRKESKIFEARRSQRP